MDIKKNKKYTRYKQTTGKRDIYLYNNIVE